MEAARRFQRRPLNTQLVLEGQSAKCAGQVSKGCEGETLQMEPSGHPLQ